MRIKQLSNNRGFTSFDFIFGITLAAGVVFFMMAVSLSLVMTEISQYISFSAARAQASAQKDVDQQELAAQKKAEKISAAIFKETGPATGTLVDNQWLMIGKLNTWSDETWWTQQFGPQGTTLGIWVPNRGAGFEITLKLFGMKIPFIPSAGPKDSFTTNISSMLVRHPTTADCVSFYDKKRYSDGILSSDPTFNLIRSFSPDDNLVNNGVSMMKENACGI